MYDSVISITWTGGGLEKPQNWRREEEEEVESMLTDVKTREAMDKESGSSSPNLGGKEGATLKPTKATGIENRPSARVRAGTPKSPCAESRTNSQHNTQNFL